MPSQQDIEHLQERLDIHRATLATLLKQYAWFGSIYVPPSVVHGIREARNGIATCKAGLRDWGVEVEDKYDDTESNIPFIRQNGIRLLLSCVTLLLIVSFGSRFWSHLPTVPATNSPTTAIEDVRASPRRIYPNPDPSLSYVWYVWRQPSDVSVSIAGATPITADSGMSWNRFWYDLAPNQFAGLALTFDAPLDMHTYTFIEVKVGFNQITDTCRLYLKEGDLGSGAPTPTSGLPHASDPGVLLGLGIKDTEDVTRASEGNGVQRVTINLNAQFSRTDLTRVIEIGFEAISSQPDPKPGRCDIYEIALH